MTDKPEDIQRAIDGLYASFNIILRQAKTMKRADVIKMYRHAAKIGKKQLRELEEALEHYKEAVGEEELTFEDVMTLKIAEELAPTVEAKPPEVNDE